MTCNFLVETSALNENGLTSWSWGTTLMRLRRLRRLWPAIPVIATLLIVYAAMPGRSTFTISPETTYVTGPADDEGFIDYSTALNARLVQGIPPENNANVLIVQALGPHPERGNLPPSYWQWLGIEPPPEEGTYFISRYRYFEANIKGREEEELDEPDDDGNWRITTPQQRWDERVDRAARWPWKAKDEPDVAAWLKQNEKPLVLMFEASKRPKYYNPCVSNSNDPRSARVIASLLPTVQQCRDVGTALCCRAMSRVANGDADGAWQDLLAVQRLGRLLSSNGTLIEMLVGIAIETTASNATHTLLSKGEYSSKQARAWLDDLRKLQPITPLADKLELTERLMTLDVLQSIAANGTRELDRVEGIMGGMGGKSAPNPFGDRLFTRSIDFDPAFRRANQVYDRYIAAARLPDRASRKQEFATIMAEVRQAEEDGRGHFARAFASKTRRGEYIGNRVVSLTLPALEKLQDASDRAEQTHNNLEIALALAAYRVDTKRYPARLEDLVPKYLSRIPSDIFSGKALIYRPSEDGYLLYSVGINGIDDDGRRMEDEPRGDDVRVRIPVSEPKVK